MTGIVEKGFQTLYPHVPPQAAKLLREMLRFSAAPPPEPSASSTPPSPPSPHTTIHRRITCVRG